MPDRKGPEAKLQGVTELADKIADTVGVRIVEVKFGQQGKKRTLEVTIYRPDGPVSHDDCEQVSRLMDAEIEALEAKGEPLLDGLFMLEVQSPGIDRMIKSDREFRIFAGHKVQIESKEKIADLGHNIVGVLLGLVEGQVKIAHAEVLAKPAKTHKKVAPKAVDGNGVKADADKLIEGTAQKQNDKPGSGKEISLDQKKITQIKLFAPDLQPKQK
jgi:ribosome maturation factor RimP